MSNTTLSNTTSAREKIEARVNPTNTAALSIGAGGAMQFCNMTDIMEFAKLMSVSQVAVPKHLRENPGACLAIVIQASEWQMSPYAVANKSYSVNDRLSYEAQLINAVILRRAPIKGRFKVEYSGDGDKRKCKVSATTTDGDLVEYESPMIGAITPKNSPLWKADPDQQLFYFSSRSMCRRHFPDVLLGVYTMDELQDQPQERIATGRVVDETARLQNPYAEPSEESLIASGELDPQPTGEPPLESPVEVSEATERAQLIDEIKQTCAEVEITFATFGGKAKSTGLLDAKIPLLDAPIAELRIIHDNRLAVAQGTYKAGGEA